MKLTIIHLTTLTSQDHVDLHKLWPTISRQQLNAALSEQQLYAARFNARLLAALLLKVNGTQGIIRHLQVRDVTRRRGVGKYLLEEVMAQNPFVTLWQAISDCNDNHSAIAAFMQRCGFRAEDHCWVRYVSLRD